MDCGGGGGGMCSLFIRQDLRYSSEEKARIQKGSGLFQLLILSMA
jgi:hypothetical protein